MIEIVETREFSRWFDGLRDLRAQANIQARIDRLALDGNPGDVKPVGEGVSELRIDYGPGYRLYFVQYGSIVVVSWLEATRAPKPTTSKPPYDCFER